MTGWEKCACRHTIGPGTGSLSIRAWCSFCVHNAGRSQMAAGWLRHLAGDKVTVASAGSSPADTVSPAAVQAMEEIGIDITSQNPQRWTDDLIRTADAVVTMGCGDSCHVFPGVTYRDWEVEDPHGQDLEVVRRVRDDIRNRVRLLMGELNIDAD